MTAQPIETSPLEDLPLALRRAPRRTPQQLRQLHADSLLMPKAGQLVEHREPNRVSPRCAIYYRRSERTDTSVSLGRQEKRLMARVASVDGVFDPDVDVFFDDDISAKGGHYRPGLEQLLRAVQAGDYDLVLIWEISRWTRNTREGRIAGAVLRDAACELHSLEEPFVSLYGPTAFFYDWYVEQAAKESAKTSARVTDWHAYMAEVGAVRGKAPWGMVKLAQPSPWPDRTAPVKVLAPDEEPRPELDGLSRAQWLREAADRVLDGTALNALVREWNEAGVPGPQGKWRRQVLTRLLRNPHLAGYAVLRNAVVLRDGEPVRFYEPVLAPDVWHALADALDERRSGTPRSANESLLRGLMRCGVCGSGMSHSGTGIRSGYRCSQPKDGSQQAPCPGVSIGAAKTEAYVVTAALELLADPERLAALTPDDSGRQELVADLEAKVAAARRRLDALEAKDLAGDFADADGRRRYDKLKAEQLADLEQLSAQLRRHRGRRPVARAVEGLDPTLPLEEAFDALERPAQTTLLTQLLDQVQVGAGEVGKRWDVSRLTLVWRQQA